MMGKIEKGNVQKFSSDAKKHGGYLYYVSQRLSSKLANTRISQEVVNTFSFADKTLIEIGCGDGTFAFETLGWGAKSVLGIDPAEDAIELAKKRCIDNGLTSAQFAVGNIYTYNTADTFDCAVFSRVLHHLPNPEKAIQKAANLSDTILIIEPNGLNPVLKVLEKTLQHHIDHEEQSFCAFTIEKWLAKAGMKVLSCNYCNLVPMFCPDWMAKTCKTLEPLVEALPLVRNIACGQYIILASKK